MPTATAANIPKVWRAVVAELDKQEKATQTVLEQAEVLSQEWAAA